MNAHVSAERENKQASSSYPLKGHSGSMLWASAAPRWPKICYYRVKIEKQKTNKEKNSNFAIPTHTEETKHNLSHFCLTLLMRKSPEHGLSQRSVCNVHPKEKQFTPLTPSCLSQYLSFLSSRLSLPLPNWQPLICWFSHRFKSLCPSFKQFPRDKVLLTRQKCYIFGHRWSLIRLLITGLHRTLISLWATTHQGIVHSAEA